MISCVVVTFNSLRESEKCLGSLLAQECAQPLEFIVVDNGSSDGTPDFVAQNYPAVKLIRNQVNLGVAKARNQGIEASCGEWVFSFDCDTMFGKGFFSAVQCQISAEENSSVGVIQPRILSSDGTKVFSYGISLDYFWRFRDLGRNRRLRGGVALSGGIDAACSAAAGYKRRMLEDIKQNNGYFDETFFFMVEDVDLGMRAAARGWKTAFCPGAVVYHKGNASELCPRKRQYFCWRNRLFMLRKIRRPKLRACVTVLCYDLPRAAVLLITNQHVRADFKERIKELFLRIAKRNV